MILSDTISIEKAAMVSLLACQMGTVPTSRLSSTALRKSILYNRAVQPFGATKRPVELGE